MKADASSAWPGFHEMEGKMGTIILAADIGGSKTDLALYEVGTGRPGMLCEARYHNRDVDGFAELLSNFLDGCAVRPCCAVLAVAGPVRGGRVRMTNLDWQLDSAELAHRFSLDQVILINDLVATAMAAVHAEASQLVTINQGEVDSSGNVAVLAPGTGLGEAALFCRQNRWLPMPSEGGHTAFAPADALQIELLCFLLGQGRDMVSVEDVCSGRGIPALYQFCCHHQQTDAPLLDLEPAEQTPAIVAAALAGLGQGDEDHPAVRAMRLFVAILAAEASDLALTTLATGGIYIGGGLPPRLLPFFDTPTFMRSFARGVYHEMLARIPVHLLTHPRAALWGAALYGVSSLQSLG